MINKAKELNASLKETLEAKEYFALKEEIDKDEYLNDLLKQIEESKKKVNDALKANDIETYKKEKNYLDILSQEFLDHPLINNYMISKNNVYNILEQVVSILSDN